MTDMNKSTEQGLKALGHAAERSDGDPCGEGVNADWGNWQTE
ncbi:MAG TPA: hypothetical protein VFO35_14340 [Steroidobacteraceae bacterium]|nr:hypothetical protein [Steroidobacteraceae bacterium]